MLKTDNLLYELYHCIQGCCGLICVKFGQIYYLIR